jgi:hypothetical protein
MNIAKPANDLRLIPMDDYSPLRGSIALCEVFARLADSSSADAGLPHPPAAATAGVTPGSQAWSGNR